MRSSIRQVGLGEGARLCWNDSSDEMLGVCVATGVGMGVCDKLGIMDGTVQDGNSNSSKNEFVSLSYSNFLISKQFTLGLALITNFVM